MKNDHHAIVSTFVTEMKRKHLEETKKNPADWKISQFKKQAERDIKTAQHFLNFFTKLTERMVIINQCIKDEADINDMDLEVFKAIYDLYLDDRAWWVTHEELQDKPVETVVQANLFDNVAVETVKKR